MDEWERRYKRKVLDYIKAPQDVDLYTVVIESEWMLGWGSPDDYTYEEDAFNIRISYKDPRGGRTGHAYMENEECAEFLRSLG